MKEIIRNVLAALAGAFTGMVIMIISQIYSAKLHPVPADLDRTDKAAMGEFIGNAPAKALLVVLAGYFVGVIAAAWVAGRLSYRTHYRQAVMVGGLFFVASLMNLTSFPHPLWFWVANLAAIVAGTGIGIKLLPAFVPAPSRGR